MELLLFAQSRLRLRPDRDGLPGIEQGEEIVQGVMFWGLLAAAAIAVVGLVVWAASSRNNNPHYASGGKGMTGIGILAAIGIVAVPALINWAQGIGRKVRGGGGGNEGGRNGDADPLAEPVYAATDIGSSLIDKL